MRGTTRQVSFVEAGPLRPSPLISCCTTYSTGLEGQGADEVIDLTKKKIKQKPISESAQKESKCGVGAGSSSRSAARPRGEEREEKLREEPQQEASKEPRASPTQVEQPPEQLRQEPFQVRIEQPAAPVEEEKPTPAGFSAEDA